MKKAVWALVSLFIAAMLIGCGAGGGGTDSIGTIEKFFDAVNKGDAQEANRLLAGSTVQDNNLVGRYAGRIEKVSILNVIENADGSKTARAYVILNPPKELPLRGLGRIGYITSGGGISYAAPGINNGSLIVISKDYFFMLLRDNGPGWKITSVGAATAVTSATAR